MKRFYIYFLYTVIMFFTLILGLKYQTYLKQEGMNNFNTIPYVTFSVIFPIIMGILFGVPQLIKKIKHSSGHKFDWPIFFAICLPALYIALIPILYYTNISIHLPLARMLVQLGYVGITVTTISGVVFGYVLTKSLKSQ